MGSPPKGGQGSLVVEPSRKLAQELSTKLRVSTSSEEKLGIIEQLRALKSSSDVVRPALRRAMYDGAPEVRVAAESALNEFVGVSQPSKTGGRVSQGNVRLVPLNKSAQGSGRTSQPNGLPTPLPAEAVRVTRTVQDSDGAKQVTPPAILPAAVAAAPTLPTGQRSHKTVAESKRGSIPSERRVGHEVATNHPMSEQGPVILPGDPGVKRASEPKATVSMRPVPYSSIPKAAPSGSATSPNVMQESSPTPREIPDLPATEVVTEVGPDGRPTAVYKAKIYAPVELEKPGNRGVPLESGSRDAASVPADSGAIPVYRATILTEPTTVSKPSSVVGSGSRPTVAPPRQPSAPRMSPPMVAAPAAVATPKPEAIPTAKSVPLAVTASRSTAPVKPTKEDHSRSKPDARVVPDTLTHPSRPIASETSKVRPQGRPEDRLPPPGERKEVAKRLMEEARELMAAKRYREAEERIYRAMELAVDYGRFEKTPARMLDEVSAASRQHHKDILPPSYYRR